MNYRILGKTNLQVSEIGFGTWPLGGICYGSVNTKDAIALLKLSFEMGINFFDTANVYGNGQSEYALGQAFKSQRTKIIIGTKIGWTKEGLNEQNFSKSFFVHRLNSSLTQLKTDHVDILYMHSPYKKDFSEELKNTLLKFKKEGKVRFLGVSIRKPNDGFYFLQKNCFDVIQVNYNIAETESEETGLIKSCYNKNIGVVAKVPLGYGFLTGKYEINHKFAKGDHRNRFTIGEREKWVNAVKKARELSLLKKHVTLTQIALNFCLSNPKIGCIIPGIKTTSNLIENMKVVNLRRLTINERKLLL